jgi:hypothetical protein
MLCCKFSSGPVAGIVTAGAVLLLLMLLLVYLLVTLYMP